MHVWKTLPDGRIQVDTTIPELAGGLPDKVWSWRDLAAKYGKAYGVPTHWILGTIYAESGGNPNALNVRDTPHGAGLMQITDPSLRAGHTDAELFDPDLNLRIGVAFLGRLVSSGPERARDLIAVSSRYNAGQKLDGSPHAGGEPWGYRESKGHIARVVAAANSAQARLLELGASPEPAGGSSGSLPFLLGLQLLRMLAK